MLARLALAAALASPTAFPAAAQQTRPTLTLGGQVRPRFESRDPGTPDGRVRSFTSMRSRLSVAAALQDGVSAFVQLQDVRLWGEETGTLADFAADGLDVHQAWAQVGGSDALLSVRAGRQEVDLGGERLVGSVGWTQQGRSFDGVRARLGEEGARASLDLFGFQLAETAAGRPSDAAFFGAYGTLGLERGRTLELYALWDREEAAGADTEQGTLGLRYLATTGSVRYRVEGAWQLGERAGTDVAAWFVGARAGTTFADGRGSVTLWLDHLSGDDPSDDEVGVFSTLFATNHKFYGYADLFTDIPAHTAGRGLQDLAVKASWAPAERWSIGADLHHFRVAEDAGLASATLGREIDLTVSRTLTGGARVTGGLSRVFEGDALAPVRGIGEDVTWGYLMLDVSF